MSGTAYTVLEQRVTRRRWNDEGVDRGGLTVLDYFERPSRGAPINMNTIPPGFLMRGVITASPPYPAPEATFSTVCGPRCARECARRQEAAKVALRSLSERQSVRWSVGALEPGPIVPEEPVLRLPQCLPVNAGSDLGDLCLNHKEWP